MILQPNLPVLTIRINQTGHDSEMWYKGMKGKELTVYLSSCASLRGDKIASGWACFTDVETKNMVELTDADILSQVPRLVERK